MKIAIIGTGNLGCSIATGLITQNAITSLYLTRRNLENIEEYKEYSNVFLTPDNRKAVKNSDILIFAVQPGHLEGILNSIKDLLTEKHVIISTITGYSVSKIENSIGIDKYVVRAMPNTAIAVSKSMTCLCSNKKGAERIKIAEAIFNRLGTSIYLQQIGRAHV